MSTETFHLNAITSMFASHCLMLYRTVAKRKLFFHNIVWNELYRTAAILSDLLGGQGMFWEKEKKYSQLQALMPAPLVHLKP